MSDRIFIDSNVLIYLFGDNQSRKDFAISLFNKNLFISTQVVNENVSVCLRKLKLTQEDAFAHGKNLLSSFSILNIYHSTILKAFEVSAKNRLSFWDSLIVSAALENDCNILYSEDMQNSLKIDSKLLIVNPFQDPSNTAFIPSKNQ
jgi:predicted nucleic acid-binding protein